MMWLLLQQFMDGQVGVCDIALTARLVEELDHEIVNGLKRWTFVIVALVLVPFLTFIIQAYYMIAYDSRFVRTFWWFVFYEYHYFLTAWVIIYKLANITLSCRQMHRALCLRVTLGEVLYIRELSLDNVDRFAAVSEGMSTFVRRKSQQYESNSSKLLSKEYNTPENQIPSFSTSAKIGEVETERRSSSSKSPMEVGTIDCSRSFTSFNENEKISGDLPYKEENRNEDPTKNVPDWNIARISYLHSGGDQELLEAAYRRESVAGTAALLEYLSRTNDRGVRLMGVLVDPSFALRAGYIIVLISFGIFSKQFLN